MQVQAGQFTPVGTGNQQYTGLTFLPEIIIFQGGQEGTTADSVCRQFKGFMTATNQRADSCFADSSGRETEKATDRCIIVHDRNTNIDRDLEASFVSFDDNGGGDYGFTLNQHNNSLSVPLGFIALAS